MAAIDMANFDFSPEEIRDINELILEDFLQAPELTALHTIFPNIKTNKFIGFLSEGGLVGLAGQGCDAVPQTWGIPGRQLEWSPKTWEVYLKECWKDLEQTMVIYAMKNGVERSDLTSTDYMTIVVQMLSAAIKKMVWRLVWFGDTAAVNYPGGLITAGVDVGYFTVLDGLWKQIQLELPAGNEQRIAIPANTGATYALQRSQLTGQMAFDTLQAMVDAAPMVLRQQAGLKFACTQSFADAYGKYLKGKELESVYKNILDGVTSYTFDGLALEPYPIWDEMIRSFEDNGTKWNNPHRVILTTPSNLAIGVPSSTVLSEVDAWYDKTTRNNYLRATDDIDTLLLSEQHIVLAI